LDEENHKVKTPVLSICIPTYNFGEFIGRAIESVLACSIGQLEIIILDGGSTDNTADVVAQYQHHEAEIKYVRLPVRGGIDADLGKTIALARGEYCWLLSADDALVEGGVARILEEIKLGCDIYLCNRIWCDRNLHPLRDEFWLDRRETDSIINIDDDHSLELFFSKAESIGALFSYMSSIVVRRSAWNRVTPALVGTNYAHVFRLFSMRNNGCRMKYLRTPLVFTRGGNDSFMSVGLLRRAMMDITGYGMLAEQLFSSNRRLKAAFLDVLHRSQPYAMVVVRSLCPDAGAWKSLEMDFDKAGYPRWIAHLLRSRVAIWPSRVILRLYREINLIRRRILLRRIFSYTRNNVS